MSDAAIASRTAEGLRCWLADCVASHLGKPAGEVATDVPLSSYGLDSVYVLAIASELEDDLDLSLDPTIMWDNPTIDALSEALVQELADNT
ncbi:acyl carrier protein [Streptomyces sp. cg2]|uniref:acyl carrier protein n=1 Tax=Streptomyces sp. cg2 TaxID=3238799 RepID=UPI0034E1E005